MLLRKIISKKWMMLCLLIGNVLMISSASSSALYENAIMQKMLTSNLKASIEENNTDSGLTLMKATVKDASSGREQTACCKAEDLARDYARRMGLRETYFITHYYKTALLMSEVLTRTGEQTQYKAALAAYSDIEHHITLTAGRLYHKERSEDGTIEVIVPKRTYVNLNLMLGDTLTLDGTDIKVTVVGVFEEADASDLYWYTKASGWLQALIMDESVFLEQFADPSLRSGYNVEWASIVDYRTLKGKNVREMLSKLTAFREDWLTQSAGGVYTGFETVFHGYLQESSRLKVTLLVLQTPIFLLLVVFIFMVSGQMLSMEQKEIAIFKSRGASKRQILLLYLEQSLILSGIGILIGLPLGFLICRIIGSANAFLSFVGRSALPVAFTWKTFWFTLGAAALSIAAMVIPTLLYADITIVRHKQKKAGRRSRPLWQRLFLDFILLGISIYIVYLYRQNTEYLADMLQGGSLLGPVMYLGSSIFILGAGLLFLRMFPLFVKVIFTAGKKLWPPSLYACFLRILRDSSSQSFLMVFLIFTMSLGIFNAQAARTINQNGEDRIRYTYGADLVVKEVWDRLSSASGEEGEYVEPDYNKYSQIEGVLSATRVLQDAVTIASTSGNLRGVSLMAIHTKEFGETAWFKDGLLPTHWYNALNAMSQQAEGVLLSANLAEALDLKEGDLFYYQSAHGSARGLVTGIVDYWPGYSPYQYNEERGQNEDHYLIVANFDQIQTQWSLFPYEIWMKMDGSTQPVYDWAEAGGVRFSRFLDMEAALVRWKNDPVTQGTNGVLTVGFIIVLVLCAVGFLIFWILSIRSRELQFGIFRAMGMVMREILAMLGAEQLLVSGASLMMGAMIGKLASSLFVPMVQMAYSPADTVIPIEVMRAAADRLRLYLVIGAVVIFCMVIIYGLIRRIRTAQALKLGED